MRTKNVALSSSHYIVERKEFACTTIPFNEPQKMNEFTNPKKETDKRKKQL